MRLRPLPNPPRLIPSPPAALELEAVASASMRCSAPSPSPLHTALLCLSPLSAPTKQHASLSSTLLAQPQPLPSAPIAPCAPKPSRHVQIRLRAEFMQTTPPFLDSFHRD